MSARLTASLSDENQSLHQRIGCMNGIFQIFDRRYFLGGRSIAGRNPKKLLPPPGPNDGNPIEKNSVLQRISGKNQKNTRKEKQRVSTESSRTSFSSTTSCSSSFSSLDTNNRAAHLETTLLYHIDFHQHNAAAAKELNSKSLEFRDIVKENMNREASKISVRTVAGEEAVSRKLKHVDSPRPMRSVEYRDSKNSGSNESFRVLARFREAHRYANGESGIPSHSAPKLNRRLSYDGRESSCDTLKSTIKIRELPRLSLDSKESWAKRSASGLRSNDFVTDSQKGNRDSEEPMSSRLSSPVVARLMGLEPLPNPVSTLNSPSRLINVYQTYEQSSVSRSSRMNDENKQQSYSPILRNSHLGLKLNSITKLKLNEAAIESHELATDVPNSSVYGEIEKRLSTLEFTKSGKDLRALKQILDTMQKSRAMLENKEQASDCASQTSMNGTIDLNRSSGAALNTACSARAKVSNSSNSIKSSIVVMKPVQRLASTPLSHDESGEHCRISGNEQTFTDKNTNTRISKSTKTTKEQRCLSTASGNSPRVTSSRFHKKLGLEKQSCPTSSSSDSSRTERIISRKVGSCSTEMKTKQKLDQKSTKRSSKSSIGPGDMNQQASVNLLKLENNGATSNTNTKDTNHKQFDNTRINNVQQDDDGCKRMNAEMRLSNKVSKVKATLTSSEQQSPVSVLDSTFYQEDSPSPVKKRSFAFEDDETINSEAESSREVPVQSQKSTETLSSEIKNLKSEIDNLRKHIRQVNFGNVEVEMPLNDCHSLMNSQHKYIWQILSESGLLKDLDHGLSAIQLHSPKHLINPNLFLALEQFKAIQWPLHDDACSKQNFRLEARHKVQRKLVFDTVNEILIDKREAERSSSNHCLSTSSITETESKGQQVLKEICTQIDKLQGSNQTCSLDDYDDASRNMTWKDLMHPSRYWGDYKNNVPDIVLDIERQIFKDLITEIAMMNDASFYDNRCRKLTTN